MVDWSGEWYKESFIGLEDGMPIVVEFIVVELVELVTWVNDSPEGFTWIWAEALYILEVDPI